MSTELTAPTFEQKEKTAQLVWTGFILMFFLIQAVIWTVAISITANDQSHVVVAGYDEKALNWDQQKRLRAASASLGWQSELLVDSASDIKGMRAITIQLHDSSDTPIENASLGLSVYHRGRAAESQQVRLAEINPGVYSGTIQVRKSGLWQFEGVASKGDDEYLISQRQNIQVSR